MAVNVKKFTVDGKILSRSYKKSLVIQKNGVITMPEQSFYGMFITNKLNSAEQDMNWGRLVINGELPEDCEYTVFVMASNDTNFVYKDNLICYDDFFKSDDILIEDKMLIMSSSNSKVVKNCKDILLLGLKGQYLWVAMKIEGTAQVVNIQNMLIYFPGDSIIKYFPEIYKKNKDSFFERYLSIFSSLNKDYQRQVDNIESFIDIDKAPDRVLSLLAKWIGINIRGGFLDSKQLRMLLKNAKYLNKYKGTRQSISKVVELFVGQSPFIVEQYRLKKYILPSEAGLYESLYGSNIYEFTVMINQELTEKVFSQLKLLINMFKPARARASIIFLSQERQVDSHCYVGINSVLTDNPIGILAQNQYLDSNFVLGE